MQKKKTLLVAGSAGSAVPRSAVLVLQLVTLVV